MSQGFWANFYVCRSYKGKTGRGTFLTLSILKRVKGLMCTFDNYHDPVLVVAHTVNKLDLKNNLIALQLSMSKMEVMNVIN